MPNDGVLQMFTLLGLTYKKNLCFYLCLLLLSFFLLNLECFAQRGMSESSRVNRNSPSANIPGFFDAYSVKEKGVVLDLYGQADYGISDFLSVGSNFWGAVSLITQAPHFLLKTRILPVSRGNVDSAISGYTIFPVSKNTSRLSLFTGTSTTSIFMGDYQALHFGAGYSKAMFTSGNESDFDYQKVAIDTFFISSQYEFWFQQWIGASVLLASPLFPSVEVETSQAIQKVSLISLSSSVFFVRFMPTIYFNEWAFSVPVFGVLDSSGILSPLVAVNITFFKK
jgi:hypothetical protein